MCCVYSNNYHSFCKTISPLGDSPKKKNIVSRINARGAPITKNRSVDIFFTTPNLKFKEGSFNICTQLASKQ